MAWRLNEVPTFEGQGASIRLTQARVYTHPGGYKLQICNIFMDVGGGDGVGWSLYQEGRQCEQPLWTWDT